ncbi:MAG TPA: hypothetical protein VIV12_20685 [Streptosporangiaceae bacterium]
MTGSPLPLGPISDREQLGWQRRAVRVLTQLLQRAQRDRLPVVQWSVAYAGAGLVARCLRGEAARRRADFDAWCSVLGATERRARRQGSTTHLSAVARHYDGLVSVALLADLDDDHDQDDAAGAESEPAGQGGEQR